MPDRQKRPTKVQLKVYVTERAKQKLADYVKHFKTNQSRAVEECIIDVLAPELQEAQEKDNV